MTPYKFKKLRKSFGLTQRQMAKVLGVDPSTLRKWEMPVNRATSRSVNPTAARAMEWFEQGLRPKGWPV